MRWHACKWTGQYAIGWHPERSRLVGTVHTSDLLKSELSSTCDVTTMLLLMEPLQHEMPMQCCGCPRPQPRARAARWLETLWRGGRYTASMGAMVQLGFVAVPSDGAMKPLREVGSDRPNTYDTECMYDILKPP